MLDIADQVVLEDGAAPRTFTIVALVGEAHDSAQRYALGYTQAPTGPHDISPQPGEFAVFERESETVLEDKERAEAMLVEYLTDAMIDQEE